MKSRQNVADAHGLCYVGATLDRSRDTYERDSECPFLTNPGQVPQPPPTNKQSYPQLFLMD